MKHISIKSHIIIVCLVFWAINTHAENTPEIFIQTGHHDSVNSVCFSPDGQYIISGSNDHTIKLWEAESGKLIRTFKGHSDWVRSVSFSPDGRHIASGSDDNTVKLWEAGSGKLISTFQGHSGSVNSVSFSPDGRRIASGSRDATIRIWHFQTEPEMKIINLLPNDQWIAIKPDSMRYFSSPDGDLYAGVRFAHNSYNWKPLSEFRERFKIDDTIYPIVRILSPKNDTHVDHHTIGIKLHVDGQSVPLQPTQVLVNNQPIEKKTILMLDAFKKDHVCDYFIPLSQNKNTIRFDVINYDGLNGYDEIVVYRDDNN